MALSINVIVALICLCSSAFADLLGIPTFPFTSTSDSTFDISSIRSITIDTKYASATDEDGWTLIPPTLQEFASTFAQDLQEVIGCHVAVNLGDQWGKHGIFLTIGQSDDFVNAAGQSTSEAYQIDVTADSITITGASPLGAWWATRTVLQQAILNDGTIALGSGTDAPGWGTRGVMLDDGRHYYAPDFVEEMCAWLSFWKQNTFHLHLSDNLYNNVEIYDRERQLELYARFRPYSNDEAVAGLNIHSNESYTREDFDQMQRSCASRGVTIIPEIEAPGHALVITQWKPKLGLDGELDLLNISYPETIPTMETIWSTFLPWFHSKAVHIGADEYVEQGASPYELAEAYNRFVNTMDSFITSESGKSMRIWGTYPPQKNYTDNISKDVTIQHWEFFEDNPLFDYIDKGYNVINSDDHCYIVNKYSTSYPQHLNRTLIFYGDPLGGAFAPNIFDPNNATNNPPKDNPRVLGHLAAQWNDYGYNTSTYLEAYYSWRNLLPALADKQWGGKLQDEDYDDLFAALQPAAPAQNLDRDVASKSSVILSYVFSPKAKPWSCGNSDTVKDLSENHYDGKTDCNIVKGALQFADGCFVATPLTSKGHDYTLSFTMKQSSTAPGPLFRGPDSELWSGNGTSSKVMLISAGNAFPLNYSLPVGDWIDASLIARGNRTFFSVNGGGEMEFTGKIGINGEYFEWVTMAVVAPLHTIGGGSWNGKMKGVKLVDHA